MYHTLAQAEIKLARFADGGACDVRDAINSALERLSNIDAFRCLKRIVRIYVRDDVLPLPQRVEALLRVCVDGKPSHVFGSDYQFLQSGVGDLDWENQSGLGFSDYGAGHSVMFDVDHESPGVLFALADDSRDQAKVITVYALREDGTEVTVLVPIKRWSGSAGTIAFDPTTMLGAPVSQISRVVLPSGLNGYVSLFVGTADGVQFLAKYHPAVIVPDFRRYRVNWTREPDEVTSVLAEVRLRFMPLVSPTDVLPFDSLDAVQYMMMGLKEVNAGNIQAGMTYRELAKSTLEEKEQAQTRVQGLVVENALHETSVGAASGYALYNL